MIFWGSDPVESHPRHFERYSVDARGLFTPNGRADRTVVVADVRPTASSGAADIFLPVQAGRDFEVLWTLRGLIRGLAPEAGAVVGAPIDMLTDLAQRMKACRFGVVFFGLGLSRGGHRTVEALLRLVMPNLNETTHRFYRPPYARHPVTWPAPTASCGVARPVILSASIWVAVIRRFNPGRFSAQDMTVGRRGGRLLLLIGSQGVRRFTPEAKESLRRIPTIDPEWARWSNPFAPSILHHDGRLLVSTCRGWFTRMDEVPIPLRVTVLPTEYPSDGEVLQALLKRLRPGEDC